MCNLLNAQWSDHTQLVYVSINLKWKLLQIVANSRSAEAFVAMCLLTVTGTSLLTQKLGFSDTVCTSLCGFMPSVCLSSFTSQVAMLFYLNDSNFCVCVCMYIYLYIVL